MNGLEKYWYQLMIFFLLLPIVNFLVLLGFTNDIALGQWLIRIFIGLLFVSYAKPMEDQLDIIENQVLEFREKLKKRNER